MWAMLLPRSRRTGRFFLILIERVEKSQKKIVKWKSWRMISWTIRISDPLLVPETKRSGKSVLPYFSPHSPSNDDIGSIEVVSMLSALSTAHPKSHRYSVTWTLSKHKASVLSNCLSHEMEKTRFFS